MVPRVDALSIDYSTRNQVSRYTSGMRSKRVLDVFGALAGLVILSPLFFFLMALIKLTDGGEIFYGHKRIGRFGQEFGCLKFRTMVEDGDAVLEAYLFESPAARKEWLETRKLQSDPRVTSVGSLLRKLSLDELPQLLNILRGDMSLVGPRPVVQGELAMYGDHASVYLMTRPGLTGLWQVSGRNDVSFSTRVAFDRQYVEQWSLAADIRIIAMTIPAICTSRGAY